MAYRENAKILKVDCLADGVYEIWFETKDIAKAAKAGQFISVYSDDGSRMLPRPISICKVEDNNLRIVFRVAGKGTEEFSKMKAGEYLDIQGPLGNGYVLGKIAAEIKAEGEQIEKGFKSVAYSLKFRGKEKNLEENDITSAMKKILNGLEGMGIQLRG